MSDPLTLTALGGLEMCDGSGQTLAVSPKRGALLVYLALARPRGPQQCDTLLALLYPEHDSTHARMALRQLVREVRQTLGVDVVRSHSRETVALDREVLQSDVWAFEAAISDGDFARAVERYTGPLLAGVHVSGCPEFEEWVEAERARLHRAYTGALEQVALAAMHDGDPGTAATWWRQLLAHEPYASRVTLGLMQALAETGDRAGALQAAAEHAARLRQDFGAEPSREVEMLAARFKDTSPRVRSRQAVALRLAAALGDRYQIEELLGVGGMALVYRASDLRHGRTVALKVLRPELAAATGPKRFLREIAIAAPLNHPNILPLYDSGEADELLYYVMPYIEGESLRDVLAREGRLNVDDAVRLAGEVADALGYAHEAGIVHRDIKPENILISHGHALIADFGVARALSTTDGESSSSGIALGTPEYTSPEQAAGEQAVDARSDVYSLGCVLYEMLGGSPPYTGTTPQQVVSAHRERPVPSVRRINPAVPQGLDAVIARAIAKEPAERYTTAAELKEALVATRVTRSDTTHVPRTRLWRVVRRVALPSLLVTATVIVGVNRYRTATSWKRQPVDANAVAVMPFRVTTTTPEVALLDQGLPDLLYSVLTGDGTVRVVNVQRLLWTWDAMRERGDTASVDARLRLAADLGAGKLMTGAVVEADTELIVNAWLHRVPDDEELAQHSFRIPKDDVNALLTGVVYGLIGAELGEDGGRLTTFAQHDSRAVRSYLQGVRSEREGNWVEALLRYEEAEGFDSSFALPVLRMGHLSFVGVRKPGDSQTEWLTRWTRSLVRARELRQELSPRDRGLLWFALVNRDGPVDSVESAAALLRAARQWALEAPDDADAQLQLALALYQAGAITELPNWRVQYRVARDSAWALDSVTPRLVLDHAQWIALLHGDRDWARRVLPSFLVNVDSTSERWVGVRWGLAHLLGDSVTVRAMRARARTLDPDVGGWAVWSVFDLGAYGHIPVDTATLAQGEHRYWDGLLPVGRVEEAAALMAPTTVIELAYAYVGLDSAAAAAADTLAARVRRNPDRTGAACYLGLYRSMRGDTMGLRESAREWMQVYRRYARLGICPAMVEAFVESHDTRRIDTPALDTLETLMRTGPGMEWPAPIGMLVVARLARERGQLARALEAAGDACCWGGDTFSRHARAPTLKEEGEIAALLGDTARAIEAFTRYLNIRVDPDPGLVQAEVDSVRAALALLRQRWSGRD